MHHFVQLEEEQQVICVLAKLYFVSCRVKCDPSEKASRYPSTLPHFVHLPNKDPPDDGISSISLPLLIICLPVLPGSCNVDMGLLQKGDQEGWWEVEKN